jgi:hypothetical protein
VDCINIVNTVTNLLVPWNAGDIPSTSQTITFAGRTLFHGIEKSVVAEVGSDSSKTDVCFHLHDCTLLQPQDSAWTTQSSHKVSDILRPFCTVQPFSYRHQFSHVTPFSCGQQFSHLATLLATLRAKRQTSGWTAVTVWRGRALFCEAGPAFLNTICPN